MDTVGKNTKMIQEYIRNQLADDAANDQISLKEYIDPFTGEAEKQGKKKGPLNGAARDKNVIAKPFGAP